MKNLLLGIALIIIIGVGGLLYRNAVEYSNRQIACPMDAMVCPDGTSVAREGLSCVFPVCSFPNVFLPEMEISFAIPSGFFPITPDAASAISYELSSQASSTETDSIYIQSFSIEPSSTALEVIRKTAISDGSGLPVPISFFTSTVIVNHRFTVVPIGRFEGVVGTAYYFARANDVLRFEAIDRGVVDWMDSNLDASSLPAHTALKELLTTLQGGNI
jgi:hypothetical protein